MDITIFPHQIVLAKCKNGSVEWLYAEYPNNRLVWKDVDTNKVVDPDIMESYEISGDYKFGAQRKCSLSEEDIHILLDDMGELFSIVEDSGTKWLVSEWKLFINIDDYFGTVTEHMYGLWYCFNTYWNPYDGMRSKFTLCNEEQELEFDWDLSQEEKRLFLKVLDESTEGAVWSCLRDKESSIWF